MPQTAYDLEPVLRAVARTTAACLGYGTAVINLYRPAWDDFHTVVVEGSDGARRLLLGQTSTADDWGRPARRVVEAFLDVLAPASRTRETGLRAQAV